MSLVITSPTWSRYCTTMETVEPFGAFDDELQEDLAYPSVSIKDGLDLHDLREGKDMAFEIDTSAPLTNADCDDDDEGFDMRDVYQQLNYVCTDLGNESGSEDDMTPFERLSQEMIDLTNGEQGVLKKVLRQGVGVKVPEGAIVRVHYNGYLEYSDEPYDSSRLRNRQLQFTLGKGEVIPGWEIAAATMQRTELSRFLVKPEYAYGAMGCPPRIPPNATIMFEIEMISFVDHKAADDFKDFSKQEREQATLEQLIKVANAEREAGNDFFQQKMFGRAAGKYTRAIRVLEPSRLKNAEEERQWKALLLKLRLNLALCYLRQCKPKPAITQCRNVLQLDSKNVKAHFRLGQAYMQLCEFGKSRDHLVKAGKLSPGNEEIRQELQKLDRAVKKFQAVEKSMYSKMFQSTSANTSSCDAADDSSLRETRKLLQERLSAFKENPNMPELVLPASLSPGEIRCAEEVAKELQLETEKRAQFGIRIFKPDATAEEIPPF